MNTKYTGYEDHGQRYLAPHDAGSSSEAGHTGVPRIYDLEMRKGWSARSIENGIVMNT